jgi:hypothetical protein
MSRFHYLDQLRADREQAEASTAQPYKSEIEKIKEEVTVDVGDNLILGASALADFIFKDRKKRRKIYHMHERGLLPLFKIGSEIAGLKSTLRCHLDKKSRKR